MIGREPLVTVIVPVFNANKFLRSCLISLQQQTFVDFEVICVNDGSTDSSAAIIDEFQIQDSRFRSFNEPHKGISAARNKGIAEAKGKYIFFLDADDELPSESLQMMVAKMSDEVDAVVGATIISYDVHQELDQQDQDYFKIRYSGEVKPTDAVIYDFPFTCWGTLYRKSVIERNSLLFPPSLLYEDTFWHWAFFWNCRKVYFLKQPVYRYFRRENSIMSQTLEKKLSVASDHLRVIEELYKFSQKKELRKEAVLKKLLEHYFWLAFQYVPDYEKPMVCTLAARIILKYEIPTENNSLFCKLIHGKIETLFGASEYSVVYIRFLRFINLVDKILPVGSWQRYTSLQFLRFGNRILRKYKK